MFLGVYGIQSCFSQTYFTNILKLFIKMTDNFIGVFLMKNNLVFIVYFIFILVGDSVAHTGDPGSSDDWTHRFWDNGSSDTKYKTISGSKPVTFVHDYGIRDGKDVRKACDGIGIENLNGEDSYCFLKETTTSDTFHSDKENSSLASGLDNNLTFADGRQDCSHDRGDWFNSFCRIFGDFISKSTLGDQLSTSNEDIQKIVNHYAKSSYMYIASDEDKLIENVSLNTHSTPEKCDSCMKKVYDQVAGDDKFEEDRKEAIDSVNESLSEALIEVKLYDLTQNMEKSIRSMSIYKTSINNQVKDSENSQAIKNQLACKNDISLSQKIKSQCGSKESQALEALKKITKKINPKFEGQTVSDILGDLYNSVSEVQNIESCQGPVKLADFQRFLFSQDRDLKDKVEFLDESFKGNTSSSQSYAFLDGIMNNEEFISENCNQNSGSKPSPFDVIQHSVIEALNESSEKDSEDDHENPHKEEIELVEDLMSNYFTNVKRTLKRVDELLVQTSDELKKDYLNNLKEDLIFKILEDPSTLSAKDKNKLLANILKGAAVEADPNLKVMLSDWGSFCYMANLKKSSDQSLEEIIDNSNIKDKNSSDVHKNNFDRIKSFSESMCEKSYDEIVNSLCPVGDADSFYDNFSQVDIDQAKKRIFNSLVPESDENRKKKIALGAASCGIMVSHSDIGPVTDPSALQSHEISAFYLRNTDNPDAKKHSNPFNAALAEQSSLEKLCDGSLLRLTEAMVDEQLHDIIPPTEVTTNYIADHLSYFSGNQAVEDYYKNATGKALGEGALTDLSDESSLLANDQKTLLGNSATEDKVEASWFKDLKNLASQSSEDTSSGLMPTPPLKNNNQIQDIEKQADDLIGKTQDAIDDNSDESNSENYQALIDKLMKQNEELRNQIYNKVDEGSASEKDLEDLEKLESQIADLQKKKDELQKSKDSKLASSKDTSGLVRAPSSTSFKNDNNNSSSLESRLTSDYGSVRQTNASGQTYMVPAKASKVDYSNGKGIVLTESPGTAAIRLQELTADDIKNGGIEIINGANGPRLIKIPGHTHYMEVSELKLFLEKPENSGLKELFKELNIFNEAEAVAKLAPKEDEVLLVSESEEQITSLRDLRSFLKDSGVSK